LGESDVGAFVQIVAVDPKQGLAIRALEDFVKLPDFFEEGAGHLTHEEERKNVLFLKKRNKKNFISPQLPRSRPWLGSFRTTRHKSLLLLFFRKEVLSSLALLFPLTQALVP
jgi:hypothetical protein